MSPMKLEYSAEDKQIWKTVSLVTLPIRFVQGWIFWGGGSRRFIYDPSKLDPYSTQWMANKLQSAMPGALLGMSEVVNYLLQHFILLYSALIIFSLIELICGLGLMLGFFTRLCGLGTAFISVSLMLLFGWQGSTCMDEWTMAVANLSMGLSLALSGSSIYSIDHVLVHHQRFKKKWWFTVLGSGPLPYSSLKRFSLILLIFTMFFTLLTYNYFRGSIITPYHSSEVSPGKHHLTLSNGQVNTDGSVIFLAYLDQGTSAVPGFIIRAELVDKNGAVQEVWNDKQLSQLPSDKIKNVYSYNQFKTGPYGIIAPLSAKATIELPSTNMHFNKNLGPFKLQIYTIGDQQFNLELK